MQAYGVGLKRPAVFSIEQGSATVGLDKTPDDAVVVKIQVSEAMPGSILIYGENRSNAVQTASAVVYKHVIKEAALTGKAYYKGVYDKAKKRWTIYEPCAWPKW